jgi:hypothetical protein
MQINIHTPSEAFPVQLRQSAGRYPVCFSSWKSDKKRPKEKFQSHKTAYHQFLLRRERFKKKKKKKKKKNNKIK